MRLGLRGKGASKEQLSVEFSGLKSDKPPSPAVQRRFVPRQKFTCSNEDLYSKEISSGGQRFEVSSKLRPQKDNPSASCLLPPAFQGASLVNKQNIVIATAKTSTTSDSFSDVVTILNNPDTLTQLGMMVCLLVLSLFLSQKTNQITTARFVSNGDKLQATRKALEQIKSVKQGQCQPCTLWSGTPN